jgi:hypothetical protein
MVNILIILLISVVLFGLYDIKRQSRAKRALPRGEPGENAGDDQQPKP